MKVLKLKVQNENFADVANFARDNPALRHAIRPNPVGPEMTASAFRGAECCAAAIFPKAGRRRKASAPFLAEETVAGKLGLDMPLKTRRRQETNDGAVERKRRVFALVGQDGTIGTGGRRIHGTGLIIAVLHFSDKRPKRQARVRASQERKWRACVQRRAGRAGARGEADSRPPSRLTAVWRPPPHCGAETAEAGQSLRDQPGKFQVWIEIFRLFAWHRDSDANI